MQDQTRRVILTYNVRKRFDQAWPIVDPDTNGERSDDRDQDTPPQPLLTSYIVPQLPKENYERKLHGPDPARAEELDRDLRVDRQGHLIEKIRRCGYISVLDGHEYVH